jgi:hypothetical protein
MHCVPQENFFNLQTIGHTDTKRYQGTLPLLRRPLLQFLRTQTMKWIFSMAKSTTSAAAPIMSIIQITLEKLTTGNYHITASQPGIRLPDNAQMKISFLWQTALRLHFSPQAKAMWQLMNTKSTPKHMCQEAPNCNSVYG